MVPSSDPDEGGDQAKAGTVVAVANRPTHDEILRFESLLRLGWPALSEQELDGWRLGSSGVYTRRANSIAPERDGRLGLEVRVARAEAHYAELGLTPVFKMTEAAAPSNLDAFLADRGYCRDTESIIMSRSLSGELPDVDAVAEEEGVQVTRDAFDSDWFAASLELSNVSEGQATAYRALLDALCANPHPCWFARIRQGGRIVSVALACLTDGTISYSQVATLEACRGQRLAERVLGRLTRIGRRGGAETAMLAVESSNLSAQRLYQRLGMHERYRYWYRSPARRLREPA